MKLGHYRGVFAYRLQISPEAETAQYWELLLWDRVIITVVFYDPASPGYASRHKNFVKTRIIARQQQVVRVDREKPQPLTGEAQARYVDKVRELLPQLDAVIFEDYGKGLLQQGFVDEVASLARRAGKLVTADPNPHN